MRYVYTRYIFTVYFFIMAKEKDNNLYFQRIQQLKKFHYKEDRLPSIIEMRWLFHVSSQSAVQSFLVRMIDDGFIRKDGKAFLPTDELIGICARDDARGGIATVAKDSEKQQIVLAKYLVDDPLSTRFAKVSGNSMEGAGIVDWDFVVVDTAKQAHLGDIIFVITFEWERLVKYYEKNSRWMLVLRSANPEFPDLPVDEHMEIWWVVIGSFRRF